jgi:hypothetical protein
MEKHIRRKPTRLITKRVIFSQELQKSKRSYLHFMVKLVYMGLDPEYAGFLGFLDDRGA